MPPVGEQAAQSNVAECPLNLIWIDFLWHSRAEIRYGFLVRDL